MAGIKIDEIDFSGKKKTSGLSVEDFDFQTQAPDLREIYRETSSRDADQVAEVNRVSRKLGTDPQVVDEDLDQARRAAAAPDFQEITSQAPVLSRKMQDPGFMAVSHDDPTLLQTERAFGEFAKKTEDQDETSFVDRVKLARETGQLQAELGLLRSQQIMGGDAPEIEARIAEIKARMLETADPYGKGRGLAERAVTGLAEMTPIMEAGMIRGNELGLQAGAAGGIAAAVFGPEAIPIGAGALYGAGMASGTITSIGEIEAGLAYDEFVDLVDDLGNTIDPTVAKSAAAVVGVINAAIEGLQIKTAIKTIPGGEELLRKLVLENAKKIVTEYGTRGIGRTAAAGARRYVGAVASETSQEIVQEITNIVVGESIKQLSNQVDGTQFEASSFEEIGTRLKDTAIESALAFSLMAAPGSVARTGVDVNRERKARAKIARQEAFVDRLVELGQDSKLKERDPDVAYADFVSELAKENGIETVYLQAGRAVQEMSQQGMTTAEILDWFKQYDVSVDSLVAAVESGGTVQLPTGRVVAKIGDDVVLQQVRGQISQEPMGISPASVDQDLADDQDLDQHFQDRDEEERLAGLEQSDVAFLEQQLLAAGRTPEQATADAQIYAAWAKVRGQKYGMTARQFLQEKWGLQFRGADQVTVDQDGITYNDDGQVVRDANLSRWAGDTKVVDDDGQLKPVFHGSPHAGFKVFDTRGMHKTTGTGVFFSDYRGMSQGYAQGTNRDAAIYSPEEIFADPELIDSLEIEHLYAIVDSKGDVQETRPTEEELRDEFDLDDGDRIELRYDVWYDGYRQVIAGDKDELLSYFDQGVKNIQPGVYEAYLKLEDPLIIDWEGKNWDNGPTEPIWSLELDGETVDWVYSQEEADAWLAENPDGNVQESKQPIYETTDDAARQARDMGYDGVIINNVVDSGPSGFGGEEGTVYVAFEPTQIKATSNRGTFDPSDPNILNQFIEYDGEGFVRLNENFWNWFDGSQAVDDDGQPVVLFHGTTHDFGEFSRSRANIENDFGQGFYFSNTPEDVSANYAGEGPDLTNRIERRAEQLVNEISDVAADEEVSYLVEDFGLTEEQAQAVIDDTADLDEIAKEVARRQLSGGADQIMPVFLDLKNPVKIGGPDETTFDYDFVRNEDDLEGFRDDAWEEMKADDEDLTDDDRDSYQQEIEDRADELYDESGYELEEVGTLAEILDTFLRVARRYDETDDVADKVDEIKQDHYGETIGAEQLVDLLKAAVPYAADYDNGGDLASSEIVRLAFEEAGYDGIIDYSVDRKFGSQRRLGKGMEGMGDDTVHYIAFRSEQIKSIFNRGTFDPNDTRVLYQDRRIKALRNVKVSDMSLEELRHALLTNDLTEIPNRRAYMEATDFGKNPKPVQVAIDADSLKWINDNMGHATGDAMLQEIAAAMAEEGEEFYHVSGDEFLAQGDSFEAMVEAMERVQERLSQVVLTYTTPTGEVLTLEGLDITYAIASSQEEADQLLAERKQQREAEGRRAGRGEQPISLARKPAERRQPSGDSETFSIAERGESKARPTAQLDLDFDAAADQGDQGRADGQRDLVGFYRPSGKPALPTPLKAELSRVVDHVQTGTLSSGIDEVRNSEQAAHVLASIRKQAKEQFLILALDADKKVIGVVDVSEGSLNASIVHPREALGAAFNVPGVDSVYLAHNHPGGDPSPSREDVELTGRLQDVADAAGVMVAGHVVLGDNGTFNDVVTHERGRALAAVRDKKIPVYGRPVFRGKRASQGEKLTSSPGAAAVFKDRPSGVMLLSTRNVPVGFVEMTTDEMMKLRTGSKETGAGRLVRAAQQTGAAAYLVHVKSSDAFWPADELQKVGRNMAKFGEMAGVRVLDVINTRAGSYRSLADTGDLSAGPEFFQDIDGPMASIAFNEDRTRATVNVFEAADFSSVVHEGGHLFLEDLKRAALQDGIDVDQWETVKEWLGVGDDNVISRDQHEKFARGFEAYLREGKAPSLTLQHAFDQFKRWLLAIYRSLRNLNVAITDDVRGVFDRLLATEDEIQEALQQDAMVAMFDQAFARDGKVSAEDAREYADLVGASSDEAARRVNRHKLKGDDQRQALWKRSAEAESYQQPLYRALYFLSRGAFPDIKLTRIATESKYNSLAVALEAEAQAILESTSEKLVIDGNQQQAEVSNAPEWFQEMNRGKGRARIDKKTAANALKQFAAGKPFRSKVGQDVVDAFLDSLAGRLGPMARDIDASDLEVGDSFTVLRDNQVIDGQVLSEPEGQGAIKIKIGKETMDVALADVIEGVVAIHHQANDVIVLAEAATAGEPGKGLGLDPDLFRDQYGDELYDQMPRYPGLWKDGGLSVAQASVETGYATPADMLDDLAGYQAKPRARWVEERVAELQVEHDDKLKAEDAIRNDLQRKMLEIESRWLARAAGQQRKAASRKALRRWAEERTARMGISEAVDVYRLIQASRRLRKQAIAAQRRGDSAKAFDLNEKVRMHEELIQVHVKTREALARMQRAWSKMVDAKVSNDYRQQIYMLLQRYQLTARDLVNRGAFSFVEGEKVLSLTAFMDKILGNANDFDSTPFFSGWLLDGANEGPWRQTLKWGELEELHDLLNYLTQRGREEFLGLLSDKKTRIQDVVDQVTVPAKGIKKKRTYSEGSVMRWITERTRRYFAQTDMLAFIFRRMDGFKNVGKKGVAGPNERLLWHRLAAARDLRDELAEQLHAKLDAKIQTLIKNAKRNKDLSRLPLPTVFRNAGRVWTWERVVALALNMGNNQNLTRIMEGLNLNIDQVKEIVGVLKAEDWRAIQGIWDAIDSLYPRVDRVHYSLNNFHVKKVPADSFQAKTADGKTVDLDGGYYPLKYDPELSDLVAGWNEQDDILNSQEALFQVPAAKSGFTRTRAESAGGLVPKLSLTVLTEHVNDALQYVAFAETVKDIDRVTRHEQYKDAARGGQGDSGVLGRQAYEMIRPALAYAIRPTPEFSASMDKWLDRERVRATAFILAWNVGVAFKQVFSVPGIWYDIGPANWAKGVARVTRSPLKSLEAMHELSTYMRNRSKSLDRDLMDSLKSLKPGRQFKGYSLDDIRNAGFILIKTMDFLAVYPSWWGAYDQAMQQNGGDIDAAVRQANEKIRASQPSGTPIDLAAFQRQRGIMRLFTLFATFVMKYGNRQRETYNAWRSGSIKTHEYLWHVWLEAVMPPLLMTTTFSVVQTGEPPEPEELARDVILYQLVGLPFWRDVASLFAGSYKRDKISSPVFQGIEIVGETANKLVKAVNEGDESAVLQLAWSLAELTSFYSGVPASRVYEKIMKGIEAMEAGDGTPLNLFIPPIEK